ncbi:TIGR02677 family protein [Kutzneria albida]|uniref:TIGR02677 family protein n=1 Tax=Kutzneria albida DSM 43870 TaxID=1449976 RepID=W5WD63_9PSEU|nr:TIGR02677 family protein [Kutzneria albida]AHH98675.1 hypothetical protein KALB_5313 [Kutzneria albida DSM 43870]
MSEEREGREEDDLDRLSCYTYLTVELAHIYIPIMRIFTSTLLTDLSATEVHERLGGVGVDVDVDTVPELLKRLSTWGNLIPSNRVGTVVSIRDYERGRHRYQISQRGEMVQRQAEQVLTSSDAAREVSRELLSLISQGLLRLEDQLNQPGDIDLQLALECISTVFVQFTTFSESVRDFYAFLAQVLFRYDLDTAEYTGFKDLLLDYVEAVTDEIRQYSTPIAACLQWLFDKGRLTELLAAIDHRYEGLQRLSEHNPELQVQRSRGRDLADWHALRAWFSDNASEVDHLRDTTLHALHALLANAKRLIRSASGELSRRTGLLRLAKQFDHADQDLADALFVAAFGLYAPVHLGIEASADQLATAATSWWHAPAVAVPVSLRERGSRAPRGRIGLVEDHSKQQEALRLRAAQLVERRRVAAIELRQCGADFVTRPLSAEAAQLLRELLARALTAATPEPTTLTATDGDLDLRIWLRPAADASTRVCGADGVFEIYGHELFIGRMSCTFPDDQEGEESDGIRS